MTSRACVDRSKLAFELQELIASGCWTLGDQNELKTGQLEAWRAAILGQKGGRISFRSGFAGYQARSRASS